MANPMQLELRPHPATPGPEGLRITVEIVRTQSALRLIYRLEGPVHQIRWPPATAAVRADDLWRTTCCEAFLQAEPPAYVELNAAPSGAWAAYAFTDEREGRADADVSVAISTQAAPDALLLEAVVTGPGLPWDRPWRAGFTAVIEDAAGEVSYWALNHPKDRPDFHDPQGFAALISAQSAPGDAP